MSFTYELPTDGCNVFYGTYIDNYSGNTRRRYYLNDGQLVLSSTSNSNSTPTGVHCMSADDKLIYKPEIDVYYNFLAIVAFLLIVFFAYRLVIHPFWRRP